MIFPRKFLVILTMFYIVGCSANDDLEINQALNTSPEQDYINAKLLLDEEKLEEALGAFKRIEKK